MYSDDHTAQAIGAYREALDYGLKLDHTPTPNIDRLAENGMRFDNAFVTNSLCKPARAVLLTGLHTHKNGFRTNENYYFLDEETFPMLLHEEGYQTAVIGKWHLGTKPRGFDHYEVLHSQGTYYNPTLRTPNGEVNRQGYTSDIITERTLNWLKGRRTKDEPFFLMYNHKAPHRNWLPGQEHLDDYRDHDLPEPSSLFYNYSGLAAPAQKYNLEIATELQWGSDFKVPLNPETGDSTDWMKVVKVNKLTKKQRDRIEKAYSEENKQLYDRYNQMSEKERLRWKYQRYVKDYLRVVRSVDDGVGKIMTYLKQKNLIDNTVIIYSADQGFFLGENGWYDKRWIYEESLRMPLIIHWPDGIKPASVSKQLVQNIDLAPTILELANIDIPNKMQGKSLKPLLTGNSPDNWRDAVYYHYYDHYDYGEEPIKIPRHYGIRTHRFTLAHYYMMDMWEMFDLKNDPEQLTNVYGQKEYIDAQRRLKEKIRELQQQYEVEYHKSE